MSKTQDKVIDEQNALKEINTAIRDLMNAIYIFQHVASNIGIKAGRISEQNTEEFGHRLRQLVIDMTGYDPHGILNDLEKEGKEAAQ